MRQRDRKAEAKNKTIIYGNFKKRKMKGNDRDTERLVQRNPLFSEIRRKTSVFFYLCLEGEHDLVA